MKKGNKKAKNQPDMLYESTRESVDEEVKPKKTLTSDEFIAEKRKTEKGNTYFLKAKEAVDLDEVRIKQSFMNP
jgi:hypothetical protein